MSDDNNTPKTGADNNQGQDQSQDENTSKAPKKSAAKKTTPKPTDEVQQPQAVAVMTPPMTRVQAIRARFAESGLKAIKLNVAREVMFAIPSAWNDNKSKPLVSLNRRSPVAVFGGHVTPALDHMPDHAITIINDHLMSGAIFPADPSEINNPIIQPIPIEARRAQDVEGGKDPVSASGYDAKDLEKLLTPPADTDVPDPDAAVIERIKKAQASRELRPVRALIYLERCRRSRQRVLMFLEDIAHDLDKEAYERKQAEELEKIQADAEAKKSD